MVRAKDVRTIEDSFISLLKHIPATKVEKQAFFASRSIRVPKGSYEKMWDTLCFRLEKGGAAEAVFDLLFHNMPYRLKYLLTQTKNDEDVEIKRNDSSLIHDIFFLNGNLRSIGISLFNYMEDNDISFEPLDVQPGRLESNKSTSEDKKKYQVALSFAGEDRKYVGEVAKELKKLGISVFYDKFEQVDMWGKDLLEHFAEIYREKAEYCVMFISKNYVGKAWPRFEKQHALSRAIHEKKEYILPVRLDDSEVPGLPPSIGYVDGRGMDPEEIANSIFIKIGIKDITLNI